MSMFLSPIAWYISKRILVGPPTVTTTSHQDSYGIVNDQEVESPGDEILISGTEPDFRGMFERSNSISSSTGMPPIDGDSYIQKMD